MVPSRTCVKSWTAVIGLMIAALGGAAQGQGKATPQPARLLSRATVNFSELAAQEARRPVHPRPRRAIRDIPDVPPQPVPLSAIRPPGPAPLLGRQATPSAPQPLVVSPSPTANFQGMSDNGTAIPPDTDGAVGPNHLVVALNEGVLIQDRSGSNISRVSLESFWRATEVFDPKVLYDPYGNRFLMSAACCSNSTSSVVYLAVSASSDPTGVWYRYVYAADSNTPKTIWADYPQTGFNMTWVSVSFNKIAFNASTSSGAIVIYISKADLYNNATTPYAMRATLDQGGTCVPATTYDNSLSTLYYVQNWNGNSGGSGYLRVSTLTGTPGSETIQFGPVFVSVPFPWDSGSSFAGAPQLGSTKKIDNGDNRMLSVLYRNGSLWAAQNVFLPADTPTHTAAQWWQFLPNGTVQQFGRVEDTTAAFFYAYPSLAVNRYGDALLGFSCFAATIYASACYSWHAFSDAAGSMRGVVSYRSGDSSYYVPDSSNLNRWGDYSSTQVDPVNDTDFWTLQEYAAAAVAGTDFWGTWWANLVLMPPRKRLVQVTSE